MTATNKRPPVDLGGLDGDAVLALMRKETEFKHEADAIRKKRKAFRKSHIQGVGIKLKNFDAVMTLFSAQDGGEEAIEDLRVVRALAQKANIDFGYQFSFFDEEAPQEEAQAKGAYARGMAAFVNMEDETENPFAPGEPQHSEWLDGYRTAEGRQKEAMKKIHEAAKARADGTDIKEGEAAKGTLSSKPKKDKKTGDADAPKRRGRPPKLKIVQ